MIISFPDWLLSGNERRPDGDGVQRNSERAPSRELYCHHCEQNVPKSTFYRKYYNPIRGAWSKASDNQAEEHAVLVDDTRYAVVDPMHNLLLATAKHTLTLWIQRGILTTQDLQINQERSEQMLIPRDVASENNGIQKLTWCPIIPHPNVTYSLLLKMTMVHYYYCPSY